jgi:hypothetical protein
MEDFQVDEILSFLAHRKDADFIAEKFSKRIFEIPRLREWMLWVLPALSKTISPYLW